MFIVLLHRHNGNPFGLRYKTEDGAKAVWDRLHVNAGFHEPVLIDETDDYGQRVVIMSDHIEAYHYNPVEQDMRAQFDIQKMQQVIQAEYQPPQAPNMMPGLMRAPPGMLVKP
jgi:hypothetical protein